MRHEVQGHRQFYKKYRKQSLRALTLRSIFRYLNDLMYVRNDDRRSIEFNDPSIRTHAEHMLRKLERNFRLENNMLEGSDVTFVGVHDRRTDYLEFRRKRLKLRALYRGYFEVYGRLIS